MLAEYVWYWVERSWDKPALTPTYKHCENYVYLCRASIYEVSRN